MTQLECENQIRKYQKAYYDGEPLISDEMFDELWDQLAKEYPNSELLKKIGSDTIKGEKIKHWMTMGSQAKFNTEEGFKEWLKKEHIQFPIFVQNKVDGNAMELQYKQGSLLHGVTRGDGEFGECADRAVFNIPSIPKTLIEKEDFAIRGEVVMNKEIFEKKYSKDFANPRNLTAGLIKNEDFSHYEDLKFIAYDTNRSFNSEYDKYNWLKTLGFDVVESEMMYNEKDLLEYRNKRNSKDREYAIDGLVLKQNRIDPEDAKEYRPKKQHAFKWKDEAAETVLIRIEWSMTGNTLTPVACFEPVELEGTTVKRASLSNISFIKEMNLKIGDIIEVRKHGQIIPHVEGVIEHRGEKEIEIPKYCPICKQPLSLSETGKRLYCSNETCTSSAIARLNKWIEVLDVKGFGPALIESLVIDYSLSHVIDLYNKKDRQLIYETYGSINAKKAFEDLDKKSKNVDLAHYIAGFNLGSIGTEMAQKIINAGFDTWPKIYNITKTDLLRIEGWSDIRADKFLEAFDSAKDEMLDVLDFVSFKETTKELIVSSISNLHICVTGKLDYFSRKEIEELITSKGGINDTTVSPKTDYLVTNTPDSGSSKNEKAKKYGTKIVTEKEFKEILEK